MSKLFLLATTAVAILCAADAPRAQTTDKAALEALEATAARFQSAYNAGNPAGIAALFAKGGVYLTPAGTLLTDPQAMEKAVDGRIKAGWTKETVKATAAHAAGDQVWGYGEYTLAGTGANEGKQIGGGYAMVLSRDSGDWRINMLIGNLKPTQDVTGMAK
jgi:ketosteroid isomerase-like protein